MIEMIINQASWQELYREFETMVDGLGMPIDEGIMDVVVALNGVGLRTTASCEGHIGDHGLPYPWVDLGHPEADKLANKIVRLLYEEKETIQLQQQHRLLYLQEELKLVQLLDAFYQYRKVVYDHHLVIHRHAKGEIRLQSHGVEYQQFRTLEEQAEKMLSYQDEMQALADFILRCYPVCPHWN